MESVELELRALRARLERLEAVAREAAWGPSPAPGPAEAEVAEPAGVGPQAARRPVPVLALAGRVLLALAGAYLIRTLSDAGVLSLRSGAALGLAYALAWTLMADRAASS